jgi:hypothetical protein
VNSTATVAPRQTVDGAAKTVEKMEASTKVTPDDITKAKEKYTKAKAEQAGIKSKYEGRSVRFFYFFVLFFFLSLFYSVARLLFEVRAQVQLSRAVLCWCGMARAAFD